MTLCTVSGAQATSKPPAVCGSVSSTYNNGLIADLNPGGADGIDFLGRTRTLHPDAIRILLVGSAEIASVADAINQGAIYKLLVKPWEERLLIKNIREAFALHKALEDSAQTLQTSAVSAAI